MFYGSINDRQMAYNSCRSPADERCETGQPVRVAVVNGPAADSTGSQGYTRPPVYHQHLPDSDSGPASHLSYLYDRAQNSQYSPESTAVGYSPLQNGYCAESPPSEYSGMNRAVPAPMRQNSASKKPTGSEEYVSRPPGEYSTFSRATAAPLHQHSPNYRPASQSDGNNCASGPTEAGCTHVRPPASNVQSMTSQADAGTPYGGLRSPTQVPDRQLSQLSVGEGRQQPARSPVGGRSRAGHVHQTLPSNFIRRMSAPGPVAQPSSHRPVVTGNRGLSSSGASSWSRPAMPPTGRQNGFYAPEAAARAPEGPKRLSTNSTGDCSDLSAAGTSPSVDGSAVDKSSIRYKLREGDDFGEYEQTSIRYTGRVNPSKTFRLLQTATGSDNETDVKLAQATARRQARRQCPTSAETEDQPHADDVVDISYVGANIPSRTFRCLQEAIGAIGPQDGAQSCDVTNDESPASGRSVRVVPIRPLKKHSSLDNILAYSDL